MRDHEYLNNISFFLNYLEIGVYSEQRQIVQMHTFGRIHVSFDWQIVVFPFPFILGLIYTMYDFLY